MFPVACNRGAPDDGTAHPELTASVIERSLAEAALSLGPSSRNDAPTNGPRQRRRLQMQTLTLLAAAIALTLGAAYASILL